MGQLETRLTKLETAREGQAAGPWIMRDLRQIGPDLWEDPDGNQGTQDALAELAPDRAILVMLRTE